MAAAVAVVVGHDRDSKAVATDRDDRHLHTKQQFKGALLAKWHQYGQS